MAEEYAKKNITGNSLWPVTVIESYASINFKLGERKMWRKAEVIADATIGIICEEGIILNVRIDCLLTFRGLYRSNAF